MKNALFFVCSLFYLVVRTCDDCGKETAASLEEGAYGEAGKMSGGGKGDGTVKDTKLKPPPPKAQPEEMAPAPPPEEMDYSDAPCQAYNITEKSQPNVTSIHRLPVDVLKATCDECSQAVSCYLPSQCTGMCLPTAILTCPDSLLLKCKDGYYCRDGECVDLIESLDISAWNFGRPEKIFINGKIGFQVETDVDQFTTIVPERCNEPTFEELFERTTTPEDDTADAPVEDGSDATQPADGGDAAQPEDGSGAAQPEDGPGAAQPEDTLDTVPDDQQEEMCNLYE